MFPLLFSQELKKKYSKNPDQLDNELQKLDSKYTIRMVRMFKYLVNVAQYLYLSYIQPVLKLNIIVFLMQNALLKEEKDRMRSDLNKSTKMTEDEVKM